MLKAPTPGSTPDASSLDAAPPWAAALNATDDHGDVTVTLLTLTLVDDLMRVSGLLRVRSRSDLRIATMPTLEMRMADGAAARLVDARTQPLGKVSWISWTFERPAVDPGRFEARIDHIELEYRVGGTGRLDVPGPWSFQLSIEAPARAAGDATPRHPGVDA